MRPNIMRLAVGLLAIVLVAQGSQVASFSLQASDSAQLIGTWRGTSTCSDRVAAPACQDETIVYEFKAGTPPGTVHWVADKIVNGKREPMGELDLTYDKAESCWKVEFTSPRVKMVWRLTVEGRHLSGTARLLPGNETVRKVDARKQSTPPN